MPVSLVAYNVLPGKIFVAVPNERGRYIITNECVAHSECKLCGAIVGEPCYRWVNNRKSYTAGVHGIRTWDKYLPSAPPVGKPVVRLRAEDIKDANILDA